MEKQRIISFEKGDDKEYITVGYLKKYLSVFTDELPILIPHPAGCAPLQEGSIMKCDVNREYELIELDEIDNYDDKDECIDILYLS